MTIKPKKDPDAIADLFLRFLGKERAYVLPETERTLGPYAYTVMGRESFWSALFRSKGEKLPPNHISKQDLEKLLDDK